jgi:phage FluMu protein Com
MNIDKGLFNLSRFLDGAIKRLTKLTRKKRVFSELHCNWCGKLLFKYDGELPLIEIKCLKCKQINTIGESNGTNDLEHRKLDEKSLPQILCD